MIPYFQKIKKEKFSAGPFWEITSVVFVLVLVGFLFFSNIKINQRKAEVANQISSLQNEINDFQKKNDQLKLQISKGLDEEYVERVARQDLGLQRQGESVVGFIFPPSAKEAQENQKLWQPGSLLQGLRNAWGWLASKI